jgi:hypothetical protein
MLPANRSTSLIDAVVDPNELWNEGRNLLPLLLPADLADPFVFYPYEPAHP